MDQIRRRYIEWTTFVHESKSNTVWCYAWQLKSVYLPRNKIYSRPWYIPNCNKKKKEKNHNRCRHVTLTYVEIQEQVVRGCGGGFREVRRGRGGWRNARKDDRVDIVIFPSAAGSRKRGARAQRHEKWQRQQCARRGRTSTNGSRGGPWNSVHIHNETDVT